MSLFRGLCILAVVVLVLAPVAAARPDEEPDPNEVARDFAKEFKKEYKDASEADLVTGIDKLIANFTDEAIDERRARKDTLEALKKVTRLRNNVVVAHLLRKSPALGDAALAIIIPVLRSELSKKVPEEVIYETALEALGKLHSEEKVAIKQLTDLLTHPENSIVSRAFRAMAGYAPASGRVRKELFEEALKSSEGVYSGAQNRNQTLERKWNIIGDDVMSALNKLSGVKHRNPADARSWFNDNKKRSWDEEED